MTKIKINKLPEGYKLVNGKVIKVLKRGGTTGDQHNYGLVTVPRTPGLGNLPLQPDVRTTLPGVPRKLANLEAEKGETVLTDLDQDGTFGLYDVGGKRHSGGGTPLNLPPQSFVYSDTAKAKLTKAEQVRMGVNTKNRQTPAKISKNYQLNKFIGNLDNPCIDKIGTNTNELMLDKNKMKLSELAFIQEEKKKFKDGVPLASHPFLVSQGIDPIQFTMEMEEKTRQEAEQQIMQQLPPEEQAQIAMMQQMQQQQAASAMQQPQIGPPQMQQQQIPMARHGGEQCHGWGKVGGRRALPRAQGGFEQVPRGKVGSINDLAGKRDTTDYNRILQNSNVVRSDGQGGTYSNLMNRNANNMHGTPYYDQWEKDMSPEEARKLYDWQMSLASGDSIPPGGVNSKVMYSPFMGTSFTSKNIPSKHRPMYDYRDWKNDQLSAWDYATDFIPGVNRGTRSHFPQKQSGGSTSPWEQEFIADSSAFDRSVTRASDFMDKYDLVNKYKNPNYAMIGDLSIPNREMNEYDDSRDTIWGMDRKRRGDTEFWNRMIPDRQQGGQMGNYEYAGDSYGRGVPTYQQGGEYNWIWNILDYEDQFGLDGTQGVDNWGWTDPTGKWKKAETALAKQQGRESRFVSDGKVTKQEAYDMFKEFIIPQIDQSFLPGGANYNEDVLKNISSYMFNSSRKYEDILLRAAGVHANASDLNNPYDPQLWANNQDKITALMKDPNVAQRVNDAMGDAYNTQKGHTLQNPHPGASNWINHRMKQQWNSAGTPATQAQGAPQAQGITTPPLRTLTPTVTQASTQPSAQANTTGGYGQFKQRWDALPQADKDELYEIYKGRASNAGTTPLDYDGYEKAFLGMQERNHYLNDQGYDLNANTQLDKDKTEYNRILEGSGIDGTMSDDDVGHSQLAYQSFYDMYKQGKLQSMQLDMTGVADENYQGNQQITKYDNWAGDTYAGQLVSMNPNHNKPTETIIPPEEERPPWDIPPTNIPTPASPEMWWQDKNNLTGAVDDLYSINKYYPWMPKYRQPTIDPVFKDPTREIAAIGEQAAIVNDTAQAFAGPHKAQAIAAKAQGVAGRQVADALDKVQGYNVETANKVSALNANMEWMTQDANKKNQLALYDRTMLTDQNYDDATRHARQNIRAMQNSAVTNMANTYNMNSLYPNFNTRPSRGGLIEITNPKAFYASQGQDADSRQAKYWDFMKKYKQMYPDSEPNSKTLDWYFNTQDQNPYPQYPVQQQQIQQTGYPQFAYPQHQQPGGGYYQQSTNPYYGGQRSQKNPYGYPYG